MKYYHVDVFSNKPFSGNGLTIFTDTNGLDKKSMQTITQEMRQFESIFLQRTEGNTFRAFIFTMEEELDFAGHPIIGAASLLHDLYSKNKTEDKWSIQLNAKTVEVTTLKVEKNYSARMNQGKVQFLNTLTPAQTRDFLPYFNLSESDLADDLPLEVVSTGLPYLIIPIKPDALAKVKVTIPNLEEKLVAINAKFFFVFDTQNLQGRTWDNFGMIEDIATGSAAGPSGAYLVKHNLAKADTEIHLRQGDFLNRPSKLTVIVKRDGDILVAGDVCKIAEGELYC
jgi:PhzF family phenazine biosynthesis protein